MGTTLTGTTPQDTYDSLIKVTDNGPLSGTAKYLSDGLGNDSVLALSTSAAGIATATIVSGTKLTVGGPTSTLGSAGTPAVYLTNDTGASGTAQQYATLGTASTPIATLFRGNGSSGTTANGLNIDNFGGFQVRVNQLGGSGDSINLLGGNVGIGTSAPNAKLAIAASSGSTNAALINNTFTIAGTEVSYLSYFGTDNGGTMFATPLAQIGAISKNGGVAFGDLVFRTTPASGATAERVRILADGGLTFNGDTAAANALDDYEEGTFTPTAFGVTTAGTTTYSGQNGYYTKIGRQVTVSLYLSYTSMTGTGTLKIGGLPFAIGNLTENYPVGSCIASAVNWTGGTYLQANGIINESNMYIVYITDDAAADVQQCVDESGNYRITMTYFTA